MWRAVPSLLPLLSVALKQAPSADLAREEQATLPQCAPRLGSLARGASVNAEPDADNPPSSNPLVRAHFQSRAYPDRDPDPMGILLASPTVEHRPVTIASNVSEHLPHLGSTSDACNSGMPAGSLPGSGFPATWTNPLPCGEDRWANGPPPISYDPATEDPCSEAWELADLEDLFVPAALLS